ncbi:MAG: hypothetical protein WCC57_05065 [Paracoccaceae bacterium]
MALQLLDPEGRKPRPMQTLVGDLSIARGRVHEFCGPARRVLAAMLMGQTQGPVIWISPGWQAERLFPDGLRDFAEPGRVIFAQARRPEELLWAMEEALRSGAAPLVVADVLSPPGLTPVRRLQLATESGAEAARLARRPAPLGVMLTPGDGGAAGVESRWSLTPAPSVGPGLASEAPAVGWQLHCLRARMAPPASWVLRREGRGPVAVAPLVT